MKIAILGPLDLEFMGGGETNSMMVGNMLSDLGHDVTYFGTGCPLENIPVEKIYKKIRFKYVPSAFSRDPMAHPLIVKATSLLSLGIVGAMDFSRIKSMAMEFDAVYFSIPNLLARRLTPILIKNGKRVILANHGTFFEYFGNSRNPFFKLFQKIGEQVLIKPLSGYLGKLLVHTQTSFQTSVYKHLGFDQEGILEIPQNNVDFSQYITKRNSGPFTVVFLGRMVKSKGVELLSEIIKLNPHIRFKVIGNGPLLRTFMASTKNSNAEVFGYVSDREKREILGNSDLMVVPSQFDSLSISAIEGLASGLPIVASDCASGPKYILGLHEGLGTLVPRNTEAFSNCINQYWKRSISNPDMAYKQKLERRSVARSVFDVTKLENALRSDFSYFLSNGVSAIFKEMEPASEEIPT